MEINTDISLQGIIVAQIPVEEKLTLVNLLKDRIQENYDALKELLGDATTQDMLVMSSQIKFLKDLSSKYIEYLNNR